MLLSKACINDKTFFPLKESDEDFANHSYNDQNQVRLMYWSDFILNINWSIVYILNIYQNCFRVSYEKIRVCSCFQLIYLQAFHIFRLTTPWYNFSQFCFYFIFIFLRKQFKKQNWEIEPLKEGAVTQTELFTWIPLLHFKIRDNVAVMLRNNQKLKIL